MQQLQVCQQSVRHLPTIIFIIIMVIIRSWGFLPDSGLATKKFSRMIFWIWLLRVLIAKLQAISSVKNKKSSPSHQMLSTTPCILYVICICICLDKRQIQNTNDQRLIARLSASCADRQLCVWSCEPTAAELGGRQRNSYVVKNPKRF